MRHNAALTKISCSDNQLTTLDVSRNQALEELSCRGNKLTALDVAQNQALKWLDCRNNLLSDRSAVIGLDHKRFDAFYFDPQNEL